MPIATFDLVLEYGDQGIILVKRTIPPYKDVWALPGLRKLKDESLDETLARIAKDELGIEIDPSERRFVEQGVVQFKEENNREDISTCYAILVNPKQIITPNPNHFSEMVILKPQDAIPEPIGKLYKNFLEIYRKS